MKQTLRKFKWPPNFFNGSSGCGCCAAPPYWIRKYQDAGSFSVIAEAPAPSTETSPTPKLLISRSDKLLVFSNLKIYRYSTNLDLEITYSYTGFPIQPNNGLPGLPFFGGFDGGMDSNGSKVCFMQNNLSTFTNEIQCFNATGAIDWTFPVPFGEALKSVAMDSTGVVYAETFTSSGGFNPCYLYKISASGSVIWKFVIASTGAIGYCLTCSTDDVLFRYGKQYNFSLGAYENIVQKIVSSASIQTVQIGNGTPLFPEGPAYFRKDLTGGVWVFLRPDGSSGNYALLCRRYDATLTLTHAFTKASNYNKWTCVNGIDSVFACNNAGTEVKKFDNAGSVVYTSGSTWAAIDYATNTSPSSADFYADHVYAIGGRGQ